MVPYTWNFSIPTYLRVEQYLLVYLADYQINKFYHNFTHTIYGNVCVQTIFYCNSENALICVM